MTDTTQTTVATPAAPAAQGNQQITDATTAAASVAAGGAGNAQGKDQGQTSGAAAPAASGGEVEVKLPDGVEFDPQMLGTYRTAATKAGLSSETASKLAPALIEIQEAHQKGVMDAWKAQGENWKKQWSADPDFGGKNEASSDEAAKRAMTMFGGPELAAELDRLGIGYLPQLRKAFAKVGKGLKEDTTAVRGSPSSDAATANAMARAEYPSMYDESGNLKRV